MWLLIQCEWRWIVGWETSWQTTKRTASNKKYIVEVRISTAMEEIHYFGWVQKGDLFVWVCALDKIGYDLFELSQEHSDDGRWISFKTRIFNLGEAKRTKRKTNQTKKNNPHKSHLMTFPLVYWYCMMLLLPVTF